MIRGTAVVRQQFGAVKWIHIPHQVPYLTGLALQEAVVAKRLAARQTLDMQPTPSPAARYGSSRDTEVQRVAQQDYLFLLEHTPVYTEGRRKGAKEALGDDAEGKRLRSLGADYIVAQRGGQITFHGPGQLVGYPIFDLSRMNNLSTRCYVDMLQTTFRSLLRDRFRIDSVPPPEDHTGVWADETHKILSIGIQVRQRITSHGFALNVCAQPLLTWFSHIVACGIAGKHMTSIERELARHIRDEEQTRPDREAAPDDRQQQTDQMIEIEPGLSLGPESQVRMRDVAPLVAQQLGITYGRDMQPATDEDVRFEADERGIVQHVWFADEEIRPLDSA